MLLNTYKHHHTETLHILTTFVFVSTPTTTSIIFWDFFMVTSFSFTTSETLQVYYSSTWCRWVAERLRKYQESVYTKLNDSLPLHTETTASPRTTSTPAPHPPRSHPRHPTRRERQADNATTGTTRATASCAACGPVIICSPQSAPLPPPGEGTRPPFPGCPPPSPPSKSHLNLSKRLSPFRCIFL